MLEYLRPSLVIMRREVRDQFRDWRIIVPILLLTLIFPAIMNFTADQAVNFVQDYGADLIGDRLIPFLLMIVGFFPISVSLVIALESFVGEKERKSIEPLLTSPLTNVQLYLGKLMAVMIPPLISSYLGITVYLVGVYRQIGWVPEIELLLQILALTFAQGLVMVSGAVIISTQTTSVRAANLLASFIIIPMSFLIQGESMVMFWGQYRALWWINIGLIVLAGLLIRVGISHFNREELLGRELDSFNIKLGFKTYLNKFTGGARTIVEWYKDLFPLLRQMRLAIIGMSLLFIGAGIVGVYQSKIFALPSEVFNLEDFNVDVFSEISALNLLSTSGIFIVWWHNIRAILLAMILGVFSFGILGTLTIMFPIVLIGYFLGVVQVVGISGASFLAGFVLPHGIMEIPALVLAGAGILMMGARLATPSEGGTITDTWVISLADWSRIMVGLVIPMLFVAAILEVFVTPLTALMVIK